jgi:hypothetical protein
MIRAGLEEEGSVMLGWLVASWAAMFVFLAAVADVLGHPSASEHAVAVARDLIIAAAALLAATYAMNNRRRRS